MERFGPVISLKPRTLITTILGPLQRVTTLPNPVSMIIIVLDLKYRPIISTSSTVSLMIYLSTVFVTARLTVGANLTVHPIVPVEDTALVTVTVIALVTHSVVVIVSKLVLLSVVGLVLLLGPAHGA